MGLTPLRACGLAIVLLAPISNTLGSDSPAADAAERQDRAGVRAWSSGTAT